MKNESGMQTQVWPIEQVLCLMLHHVLFLPEPGSTGKPNEIRKGKTISYEPLFHFLTRNRFLNNDLDFEELEHALLAARQHVTAQGYAYLTDVPEYFNNACLKDIITIALETIGKHEKERSVIDRACEGVLQATHLRQILPALAGLQPEALDEFEARCDGLVFTWMRNTIQMSGLTENLGLSPMSPEQIDMLEQQPARARKVSFHSRYQLPGELRSPAIRKLPDAHTDSTASDPNQRKVRDWLCNPSTSGWKIN